ncbi:MAG: PAS domain S-box protein, partial [Chloroflexi bacterium]|nr:PAS domain S-box protein [Chloroflexota bacterium]
MRWTAHSQRACALKRRRWAMMWPWSARRLWRPRRAAISTSQRWIGASETTQPAARGACYNPAMLMRPDLRTQQRDFLLSISRAITAQLDQSEVLRRVLQASLAMLAGRVGIIALTDRADGRLVIRAYRGISADIVPQLNHLLHELMSARGEAGFSREFLNAKLQEMADAIDKRLQQSIAMPLVFAQNPLGLLVVFRSYHTAITPEDLSALQSFADQAAIAVNNAQLYGAIAHERQRLSAILNSSGDGFFTMSPSLRFLQVNTAFERMTGWRNAEALDKHKSEIINWARLEGSDIEKALSAGWAADGRAEPIESLYVEGELIRRDSSELSIGITYAPLRSAVGELVSIIGNVRDITNFRKAQEMQSVFISTVHHELRTPIAIIKGYASTLGRDDVEWGKEAVRDYAGIIEDEADRLTALVEDLLTASKIQAAQQLYLHIASVDLPAVAGQSVARLESGASQDIALSFPDDFPLIQGDSARLRQVIDNLLTNAIKYSPADSTVTVGGRYSLTTVTVFVRDQGPGIPKDQLERIFERFYRIDDRLTRRTQGTGLGLYLARAIVQAHGGDISV